MMMQRTLGVIALVLMGLLAAWAGAVSAAPPVAATLVQPSGVIGGSSFTFTWQAADGATFYYLQVNDATASPRLTLWYPAGMACPGGSATCSATLTVGWAAGPAIWWVQTWNADGFGPWSAGMRFAVNYAPGAWSQSLVSTGDRFQLVMGGVAVLDRETGLVWQRTPGTSLESFRTAQGNCALGIVIGGRRGWRLPTIEELMSLSDGTGGSPQLPAGHPFAVADIYYWSATDYFGSVGEAFVVRYVSGSQGSGIKTTPEAGVWCVRGGLGPIN